MSKNGGYAASEAWAQQQTRTRRTPIFTYYFDRKQPAGGGGFHMTNGKPPFGASTPHSSEIAYVFGTLDTRKGTYTDYDQALSDEEQRIIDLTIAHPGMLECLRSEQDGFWQRRNDQRSGL